MQVNSFTDRIEAPARKLIGDWTGRDITLHVRGHKAHELVLKSQRLPLSPIAVLPLQEASLRHLEPGSLEEHFPDGSQLRVQLLGYLPERKAWYATRRPLEFMDWAQQYPPGTVERGQIVEISSDRVSVKLESGLAGIVTAHCRQSLEAAGKLQRGVAFYFEVYGWFGREWEVQLDLPVSERETLVALDYKRWAEEYPEGSLLRGRLLGLAQERALVELAPGFTGELRASDCASLQAAGRFVLGENVRAVIVQWSRSTGRVRLALAEQAETLAAARAEIEFTRRIRQFPRGSRVRGSLRIQRVDPAAEVELAEGVRGKLRDEDCVWLQAVGRWREGEQLDVIIQSWCSSHEAMLELPPPPATKSSPLVAERIKKYPLNLPVDGRIKALAGWRAVVELEPGIAGLLAEHSCRVLRQNGRWRVDEKIKVAVSSWNLRDAIPFLGLIRSPEELQEEHARAQQLPPQRTGRITRLLPGTALVELEPGLLAQLRWESCGDLKKQGRWRVGEEIQVTTCAKDGAGRYCALAGSEKMTVIVPPAAPPGTENSAETCPAPVTA